MTALGQQRARGDELDTQLSEVTDQLPDARRELQSWIALWGRPAIRLHDETTDCRCAR